MSKSTKSTKTTKTTVTAADLRAYFRADAKRMEALSPAARQTVEKGARGRIHKEAVALHNKRRKVQYATGATNAAKAKANAEATAMREQAREAGFAVGKRGPLPKEFLASLKG